MVCQELLGKLKPSGRIGLIPTPTPFLRKLSLQLMIEIKKLSWWKWIFFYFSYWNFQPWSCPISSVQRPARRFSNLWLLHTFLLLKIAPSFLYLAVKTYLFVFFLWNLWRKAKYISDTWVAVTPSHVDFIVNPLSVNSRTCINASIHINLAITSGELSKTRFKGWSKK